jgi:ribonuclease G
MANKKIVINDMSHETRVALVEDDNIVELFIERAGASDSTGNIYKGRVQRVLPGMQAAFVDIGLSQAAFIYVSDIHPENYKDMALIFNGNGDEEDNGEENQERASSQGREPSGIQKGALNIVDLLKDGQEILVQVAKSPIGTKGARITSHISLPGRFLVLMPTSNHIGVSPRSRCVRASAFG